MITVVWICVVAPRELGDSNLSLTKDDALALSTIPSLRKTGWQPWSADAVTKYQSQGRPVFVDFTASWCLSCQVNERIALSKPEVQKAFADANIILMRADWTRYDDNITRTLNSFGRSGVPTYALYVPGETQPRLLPEVLTPGIVTNAIAQLPRSSSQTTAAATNRP
jgi:thiol:disulfide interchange protein